MESVVDKPVGLSLEQQVVETVLLVPDHSTSTILMLQYPTWSVWFYDAVPLDCHWSSNQANLLCSWWVLESLVWFEDPSSLYVCAQLLLVYVCTAVWVK